MAKPSMAECDRILTQPGSPFELEDAVIRGKTYKVYKRAPATFRDVLLTAFRAYGPRTFLSSPLPEPAPVHLREHVTYDEVYARALKLAAWLRERGVGVGTRVAVGGSNSTGWVVSFVAVHILGAVPTLLNAALVPDLQVHCLSLVKPAITLVDYRVAERLGPMTDELAEKGVRDIYCWSSLATLAPEIRGGVQELGDIKPSKSIMRYIESGGGLETLGKDSDCMIMFTSGTTSKPKAALQTQRGCIAHGIGGQIAGARYALRNGATYEEALTRRIPPANPGPMLVPVPIFHLTGCLSWLVKGLVNGHKLVFMRRWDVAEAARLMVEDGVRIIGGVPAIVTALVQTPHLPENHVIQSVYYGGSLPPAGLAKATSDRFGGVAITNGYGMTEVAGAVASLPGQDYLDNPTSVGPPSPHFEVKVVDIETRRPLPVGATGLLLTRSCATMVCYVGDEAATRAAIDDDDYYNTGDLAALDENGWIYIRDRHKDIIIRGGENIASAEVEHALSQDPRLGEVAAVSVPHDLMGEVVGAAVTLAPGAQASGEHVVETVMSKLRSPAVPAIVVIIEDMPRNATGKILKDQIRTIVREAWEARGRASMAVPRAKL